jgi:hypothetical protein
VRIPELPLDNRQRDSFVRHLDRMSMPEPQGLTRATITGVLGHLGLIGG